MLTRPCIHPTRQVNYQFGVNTFNTLKGMGADIEFKTYRGMGHSATPSELAAVGEFFGKVLPKV